MASKRMVTRYDQHCTGDFDENLLKTNKTNANEIDFAFVATTGHDFPEIGLSA